VNSRLQLFAEEAPMPRLMMDELELLKQLESDSLKERGLAAWHLSESFSEEVGDRLVESFLTKHCGMFTWLVCRSVVTKWVVKLERALVSRDKWPLDSLKTACLIRGVKGMRLPSIERHLEQFLNSDDWTLKLAAVNYCHDKQDHVELSREVCLSFLEQQPKALDDTSELASTLGVHDYAHLVRRIRRFASDFGPCEEDDELLENPA
jgi:hypothetical protein